MAAVKKVSSSSPSSDDVMESPLKLVEQTLNAVSMRQRIGSSGVLSTGMHFKAPSKSIYATASNTVISTYTDYSERDAATAVDGKMTFGNCTTTRKSTDSTVSWFSKQPSSPDKERPLNNSNASSPASNTLVGAGDDSQHSSTSEYGSMADTHSTVSDSRLSSPMLSRNASKTTPEWKNQRGGHEKSPSWPVMSYNASVPDLSNSTQSEYTPDGGGGDYWHGEDASGKSNNRHGEGGNGKSNNTHYQRSAVNLRQLEPEKAVNLRPLEPENADNGNGAGDTSTLRRCSAQSMREICPKLLKQLQQPQQYRKGQPQERPRYNTDLDGRSIVDRHVNGSTVVKDEDGRIPFNASRGGGDLANVVMTNGNVENASSTVRKDDSRHSSSSFNLIDGQDRPKMTSNPTTNAQRSLSSENISGGKYLESTTDSYPHEQSPYYHSSAIFARDVQDAQRVNSVYSYNHIRHVDEDEEDDLLTSVMKHCERMTTSSSSQKPISTHVSGGGSIRYQQRPQHRTSGPTQISIRRKRRQAAAAAATEVASARSLPDLTGDQGSHSGPDEKELNDRNGRGNEKCKEAVEEDALAYATSQRLVNLYPFTTPSLYAVPSKAANLDRTQFMTTKSSPPPPPLPRKPPPPPPPPQQPPPSPVSSIQSSISTDNTDRIYHCRAASDTGLAAETSSSASNEHRQEGKGNSVAMITRKLFADQIRKEDGEKSLTNVVQYSVTTSSHQFSNFPPASINRRVVQVHPMCMNSSSNSADHDTAPVDRHYAPSDRDLPRPDTDSNTVNNANKPRPPVPKKPPRLTASFTSKTSSHQPTVPLRPPKPLPNNCVNGDGRENGSTFQQQHRENGFSTGIQQQQLQHSLSTTTNVSPFKQRKQLEDEEKCRELTNYVAEKSNDSSLRQILAPNQRCSIDYLEECFANGRLSGMIKETDQLEGRNGGDGGLHATVASEHVGLSRRQSHSLRLLSTDSLDLEKEKIDLIARMSRKLKVLKEEQRAVDEEIRCNSELGASLVGTVEESNTLTKQSKDRFRQFIIDLDIVTQLLLKLSVQLARIDNELHRVPQGGNYNEKAAKERMHHLVERRRRLVDQLHDAKDLKEDLDRRGDQIIPILKSVLSPESLADYQYFVQMKYKLLLDAREIDDKIKLGEEQICALEQSLSKS